MDGIQLEGIFSQGYGFIPKAVMRDKELHIIAKGIYSYICSYSGKGKDAFPSQKLICYDLDISKDTLAKYMKQLTTNGYIEIKKNFKSGKFANNLYSIKMLPCRISSDTVGTDAEITGHGETDTIKNKDIKNKDINKNNDKNLGEQVKELSISNNLKDKFIEYIKFRKSIKKSLNTMRPITSSINQIGKKFKSEQHLIESLDYSMDNEYQGIIPTKCFNNKNNQTKDFKPTNRMDILKNDNPKIESQPTEVEYID